jgi:hypothetical protein
MPFGKNPVACGSKSPSCIEVFMLGRKRRERIEVLTSRVNFACLTIEQGCRGLDL